ncbi:ABC transporter ATP-binding protein [Ureibacillus composti]
MKTVFSYIKPYRVPAMIAFSLMLIEMFVELFQPLIIAKIIDEGILLNDSGLIWKWGIILVLFALLAFTSGVVNSYFSSHAAQSFSYDLRNALFEKIQSFTITTYLRFPTSGLITRLTNDVQQVQSIFFMSLRIMLRAPLVVLGSLIMAFFVNAKIAFILCISTPILIIFLVVMVRKGVQHFGQVQRGVDQVNRVLQESLQAIRLVKAYMRGTYEMKRFEKVAENLKFDTMKALRVMEIIMPVLLFFMNLSMLAVLWFGSKEVSSGNAQVGELVAVVNYAMRITGNFSMFAFIIMAFSRAKASAERIEEILILEGATEETKEGTSVTPFEEVGLIRFENVTFTYPNTDQPVLKNISFTVNPGEKLAVLGATGSGKSTLLSLIPRFYEPSSGDVYIGGRNSKEWDLEHLRSIIGYVPQQSMLFTGSITENVSWGKQNATLGEVIEAATKAQIHSSIEKFPQGYNTRVGQKGVNLSGGQKQRLSIARALIRHAKILILDDSTSALDVRTEMALWDALEEEGATKLVVTQKIQTAKGADRILLLDEGRIVANGTHDELLKGSTEYKKIVMSQQDWVGEA